MSLRPVVVGSLDLGCFSCVRPEYHPGTCIEVFEHHSETCIKGVTCLWDREIQSPEAGGYGMLAQGDSVGVWGQKKIWDKEMGVGI